jgi:hypothetical protein
MVLSRLALFERNYYHTNPNGTQSDDYGMMGNFNPYNGSYGTRPAR